MAVARVVQAALSSGQVVAMPGPVRFFEHLGNDNGASIEVSADQNDWNTLYPGEKITFDDVQGVVYIRNPNKPSTVVVFFIRYGDSKFASKNDVGLSRDGRHPLCTAIYRTDTSVQLLLPDVVPKIPTAAARRPAIKNIALHNSTGAAVYAKFWWGYDVTLPPIPGATSPVLILTVPAHGDLLHDTTNGLLDGSVGSNGVIAQQFVWVWFTTGEADADNTAPGSNIRGIIATC